MDTHINCKVAQRVNTIEKGSEFRVAQKSGERMLHLVDAGGWGISSR